MLKLQASTSVAYIRQIIADKDSILDSVPRLRPADLISRLEVQESQVCLTHSEIFERTLSSTEWIVLEERQIIP